MLSFTDEIQSMATVDCIYLIQLDIKDTTYMARSASHLDLHK